MCQEKDKDVKLEERAGPNHREIQTQRVPEFFPCEDTGGGGGNSLIRRSQRLGSCLETALTKCFTHDQENWLITKNDQSLIKDSWCCLLPQGLGGCPGAYWSSAASREELLGMGGSRMNQNCI